MADRHDVIIIGAGIAGASVAYFLARAGVSDVLLLEREEQPGYHTTGRSAALFLEHSTDQVARRLLTEAAPFVRRPPDGFPEELVDAVGVLLLAGGEDWDTLRGRAGAMADEGIANRLVTLAEMKALVPVLDPPPGLVDGGMLVPDSGHLDVHGLHWGYLGQARRQGCELRCDAEVTGVIVEGGRCVGVETRAGQAYADVVVNAAGAWVQTVGQLAEALPLTFSPLRRTIITFDEPAGLDCGRWPMVDHEGYAVYFKPESGGLLASPMDETPSAPCDARPDELDVATAVDRLQTLAPSLAPRALRRRWAGLRTFSPDRLPVIGPDPRVDGFFWMAGQGGWGIEMSPATGRLAAELIDHGSSTVAGADALRPARFNKLSTT